MMNSFWRFEFNGELSSGLLNQKMQAVMWRREIVLLATVVLVMCAGIVVGRLSVKSSSQSSSATNPATNPTSRPARVSIASMPDILQVSPDQRAKMDAIWQHAGDVMRKLEADRRQLETEHNQKILALFTPEQLAEYNKINGDYSAGQKELNSERGKTMSDADKQTVAILDDKQREKYDQLRYRMNGTNENRGRRGMPGGPATRRSSTRPATVSADGNHSG
jgi:hypothetical protein